jgi:SAM-dependent methyltransferase
LKELIMRTDYLEFLQCPYCGGDFQLGEVYREHCGTLQDGFLECGCFEAPFIDGILIIKQSSLTNVVTQLLKRGEREAALGLLLNRHSEKLGAVAEFFGRRLKRSSLLLAWLDQLACSALCFFYKKYTNQSFSYRELLGRAQSDIYLKNRHSAESYWSLYPFIPVLEGRRRLLDLSCGVGQSSFFLSNYVRPENLVSADFVYRYLYLAKKNFVKDTFFVCLDANSPLPFKDDVFEAVLMLDAFHYISTKALLAQEMMRTLCAQGVALFLHIHNALAKNKEAGWPLSPSRWASLFKEHPIRILPEAMVVTDLLYSNSLDLTREYSLAEVDNANALIAIATRDVSLFRYYSDVWIPSQSKATKFALNPIYTVEDDGECTIFARQLPSRLFRDEFPLAVEYLPERYVVRQTLNRIFLSSLDLYAPMEKEAINSELLDELRNKFIIVEMP